MTLSMKEAGVRILLLSGAKYRAGREADENQVWKTK